MNESRGRSSFQNTPEAFQAQLQVGQYNELRVALHFMLQGCHVRIVLVQGHYDLEVRRGEGPILHVEVKWDRRAAESGNLYFEVENTRQRRPSGIMATQADLWCHVLGDGTTALLVEVDRLRSWLRGGSWRSVNTSGVDSNSRGLLVPQARALALPDFKQVQLPTIEGYFGELHLRQAAEGR